MRKFLLLMIAIIFICGCKTSSAQKDTFFENTRYVRNKNYNTFIPMGRKKILNKQEFRLLPTYEQEGYTRYDYIK